MINCADDSQESICAPIKIIEFDGPNLMQADGYRCANDFRQRGIGGLHLLRNVDSMESVGLSILTEAYRHMFMLFNEAIPTIITDQSDMGGNIRVYICNAFIFTIEGTMWYHLKRPDNVAEASCCLLREVQLFMDFVEETRKDNGLCKKIMINESTKRIFTIKNMYEDRQSLNNDLAMLVLEESVDRIKFQKSKCFNIMLRSEYIQICDCWCSEVRTSVTMTLKREKKKKNKDHMIATITKKERNMLVFKAEAVVRGISIKC